jgi:hypothetical protein
MNSILTFITALFCSVVLNTLSMTAYAVEPSTSLPTVSSANFAVGQSWTWDYFDPSDKIYSTERYTVIAKKGDVVLIEMASDYSGGQNLQPHHRIQVDVAKCLAAYKNPVQKKPWRFAMYYLSQGKWTEIDQENTLAFEEKFNCNGHLYSKPSEPYLTAFDQVDGQPVFSQKLWRKLEGSWFASSGSLQAMALFKKFSSDPSQLYKMKLRAQQAY